MTVEEGRLTAVVAVAVAVPVAVLIATVVRLSAATRDRRLAALRLLGLSPARTQAATAVEAGALAAVGAVAGAVAFVAARPGLLRVPLPRGVALPDLPLHPAPALAVLAGVPLLAVAVSLAPAMDLRARAAAVRREGSARRPSPQRLVPLGIGAAALVVALLTGPHGGSPASAVCVTAFFVGAALTGLGIPLATPVGVRLLADVLARGGRPGLLLAARRLQTEPAATTRVVAALLAAAYVVVGGRCVLQSWADLPQYQRAARADGTGPQLVWLQAEQAAPAARVEAALRAVRGVRQVVPQRYLDDAGHGDGPVSVRAQVGTCADLAALAYRVDGCRDGQPAWVRWASGDLPRPAAGTPLDLCAEVPDADCGPRVRVIVPAADVVVHVGDADPNWTQVQAALLLPPSTPGLARALPPVTSWAVVANGGERARDAVARTAEGLGLSAQPEDLSPLEQFRGYQAMLWALASVMGGLALVALVIAGADRAVARRREVAALQALGVPARVVRRSHAVQALVPLLLGLPLSAAGGLLAGTAYLALGGEVAELPWRSALAALLVGMLAVLVVPAASLLGLGRRLTPELLRRE
jgi:hypothetical protein